jgi:hypothetical protein
VCSSRELATSLVTILAVSAATISQCDAANAVVIDPRVLTTLSLEAGAVKYQARCEYWIAGESSRARACLYVQTADAIYFLSRQASQKTFVIHVQRRLEEIENAALQHFGLNRQVQLRLRGDPKLLLFNIAGTMLVDARKTEAVYASLVASGVSAGEPVAWISAPEDVVVPVYVGH